MVDSLGLVWQVESLRLTAFPMGLIEVKEYGWWQLVTGEQPESRRLQPRTGEIEENGPIAEGGLVLTLKYSRDRIDWFLGDPRIRAETGNLQTCGAFSDAVGLFQKTVATWFPQAPPIYRLAFGAILRADVLDLRTGYAALSQYLPAIKLDPDGSTDFSYAINRPRESRTCHFPLKVNRLSRWSVAQFLDIKVGVSGERANPSVRPSRFVCRLELDMNTDAAFFDELPREEIPALLIELSDLGREISEKGDVI